MNFKQRVKSGEIVYGMACFSGNTAIIESIAQSGLDFIYLDLEHTNFMLDYVAAVSGGFLFGSEGLDLENCPYIGDGFLLFLTKDGQKRPDLALPQLSGGVMELLGMTAYTENSVLCYGLMLEYPTSPDKPFLLEVTVPPGP